ncbi:MAG: hypothetical protein LAT53_07325 [Idiomarina sp.]|nr:hypothetical protein [Idiomarina sp.]
MNKDVFKEVFNLEYLKDHFHLWRSGEEAIGRLIPKNIDIAAIQDFLASHPEAHLMLEEAQSHADKDEPLSATATDLIFTCLDEAQQAMGYH